MNKTFLNSPSALLALAFVTTLSIVFVFQNTFVYLYANWHREEYSHGFMIPLISAYLLWQRRDRFRQLGFQGSWAGVFVAILGIFLYFMGSLASITGIDAYALVVVIAGCTLAVMGWEAFKVALVPIALLLLMNPIPTMLHNNLSSQLQLISSEIGVAVIRLFGVSVFLEGNVIDLGSYQLQVAEACSGLRYLFPLMTIGVLVAYMFKGRLWMRWCIFLSTIPITVLMNSFRIGVIGVLVDRYGVAQAEGFLHDFEGWVIFMACFALLLLESWLLLRLSGDRRPFRSIFALDGPILRPQAGVAGMAGLSAPVLTVVAVLLFAVYPARTVSARSELIPARTDFTEFPLQVADWQGRRDRLETIYLDELKLDDYLLANYVRTSPQPTAPRANAAVNLYAAYYSSQRSGRAVHSPRSCLPGGGWRIEKLDQYEVGGVRPGGAALRVNRAVIQQGEQRQLVYYWFQQRGRNITNEYLVKWYMFADSLTRNRTDGALVRLVTPVLKGEDIAAGDARLAQFSAGVLPLLNRYLPD